MTNLKLNFTISELIKSDKASKKGIRNTPTIAQIDNILNLIFYCLQPVRNLLNKPMIITSGFRNPQVNKLVNGKANSQHLEGKAADFIVKGETVAGIIFKIQTSNIEYDQLINEYDRWVHISFSKNSNRRQILNQK